MRFFLILAVVLAGIWLWRSSRPKPPLLKRPQDKNPSEPVTMICCAQCAVHIPSAQAIQGTRGSYCCLDHLHQAER